MQSVTESKVYAKSGELFKPAKLHIVDMNNYNVGNSKFSKEFNMSSMEPKTLSYYQSRNMESMN